MLSFSSQQSLCSQLSFIHDATIPPQKLLCVSVLVTQSCPTLRPHGLQSARLLCPLSSQGKNTGLGSHSLLQRIFPTPGSNPGLFHCRQILYHLSHQGMIHFATRERKKSLKIFHKYDQDSPLTDLIQSILKN